MLKSIAVELTERELEIIQSSLHNEVDGIYSDGTETEPSCIEVKDLSDRIDSIYTEFDLIPESHLASWQEDETGQTAF